MYDIEYNIGYIIACHLNHMWYRIDYNMAYVTVISLYDKD